MNKAARHLDDATPIASFGDGALPAGPHTRAALSVLDDLRRRGYSDDEITMLVVPKRTLARRIANSEDLTVEETDKALRLERMGRMAERVFGDPAKAQRWMRKPKDRLRGETPVAYLASESGSRVVEEMLLQIQHGMF